MIARSMQGGALHDHVLTRRDIIVEKFQQELSRRSQTAGALAPSLLVGTLPEFFEQLAAELAARAGTSLAEFALPAASDHGRSRSAQGFDLRDVVREYGVLLHVILKDLFEVGVEPSPGELQALHNAINASIADAVVGYSEQTRLLRETLDAKQLELESNQFRLSLVTKHVPLVLFTATADGEVDWYNDYWFEYAGRTGSTTGRDWLEAAHPDDRSHIEEAWRAAVRAGAPFSAEYRLRAATGSYRWHLARASPIRDANGRLQKWFGTCTDVDEQKRHEEKLQRATTEAERLSSLKDEFLATVSHELRTPLQAILGWSSLLRTKSLDESDMARATEAIERNAKAQSRLIAEILDLSRIITGRARLQTTPVDVRALLQEALETVAPAAQVKSVELQSALDERVGTMVADEDCLRRIVWNLLSNAVKFTPVGGRVNLTATRGNDRITISVEDNGKGISKDFLPFVFDPFRQAQGGPARTQQGLGLGLAIVRHLVQQHGGVVTARSEGEDRGSTFCVTFPVQPHVRPTPPEQRAARKPSDQTLPSMTALSGVKALLVDDDDDSRDLISAILSHYGAWVRDAASADEALDLLKCERFDVMVSDIAMPQRDGYQLIQEVRSSKDRPGVSQIPAIALTAYARQADRMRALHMGYDRHLAKPIQPTRLVSEVARLTAESKSH